LAGSCHREKPRGGRASGSLPPFRQLSCFSKHRPGWPIRWRRELTKLYEDVQRERLDVLAAALQDAPVKGEIVILVGPPEAVEVSDALITKKLTVALDTMSLRDAAAAIADLLSVPKSRVYDLGLTLRRAQQ
jgi:16S rRNA C1402 (ribose-2'-O) methylase RsmI